MVVETLEGRVLLAYSTVAGSYSVNGAFVGAVTIQGDNAADSLVIAKDTSSDFLVHTGDGNTGPNPGQFVSSLDWDSTTAGVQQLAANSGTTLGFIIGAGAVTHSVTIGNAASPASNLLGTQFTNLAGPLGATRLVAVDDSTGTTPAVGGNAYSIATGTGPNFILSGPGFQLNEQASANGGVTLRGGTAANTYNLLSTFGGEPVHIIGGPSADTFNIRGLSSAVTVDGNGGADSAIVGNPSGTLTGINASLSISDTGGLVAVQIADQNDATSRTVTIGATSVSGLTAAPINLANLASLRVDTGTNGNTYNVNATPAATTLNTGTGADTVDVSATTSSLTINGQDGADTVHLGVAGSVQAIQGAVSVSNAGSFTALDVDDSADATARAIDIGSTTITGLAPATITYGDVGDLTVRGGTGGNTVTLNNPGSLAAAINAGGGSDTVNVLASSVASLTIDGQGGTNSVVVGDNGSLAGILNLIDVFDSGGTSSLRIDDSNSATARTYLFTTGQVTISGLPNAITYGTGVTSVALSAGAGADTLNVNLPDPSALTSLVLNGGAASDSVNVLAVKTGLTVDVNTANGAPDVTTIGNAGRIQDINGTVNVSDSDGIGALIVDDSANTEPQTYTVGGSQVASDGITGTINYLAGITALTLRAGTGGNAVNITGTSVTTDVFTGAGANSVHVLATTAPLAIHDQGTDQVTIGNAGSVQAIAGTVALSGAAGSTTLTVDDSADAVGRAATLAATAATGTLSGLAPASIVTDTASLHRYVINSGTGNDSLTVNFTSGNPIPAAGLAYDGGTGGNTLNLIGGVFANETYAAAFPGAGQIALDGSTIDFSNLAPINDVAAAASLTFFSPPGAPELNVVDGPVFMGFQTAQYNSGASNAFELMNFANKTNVTLTGPPTSAGITINNPTAAAGLASLVINAGNSGNALNVLATPPAVALSVNLGAGADTATVAGPGVAVGTTPVLDGGPAVDSLSYDAGGQPVTVTAGPNPNEVFITPAAGGVVDSRNFEKVILNNTAPVPPVFGPIRSIGGVEGATLVDATVATFTSAAPGAKAGDFAATIDWGDGTTTAGTITVDASNPGVFFITGTHTYAQQGAYGIGVTVVSSGSSGTATINGVAVTTVSPPSGPVSTTANANIANGALTVSVQPITGLAGVSIPAGPIASFIDLGGAHAVGSYTAEIRVVDASNNVVVDVPAASIVQNGNTNSYTINAPAFLIGLPGTYTVLVTATDTSLPTPVSATGSAQAIIAAGTIAAAGTSINSVEGQPFTGVVATFTDTNPLAAPSHFSATIDWGDGHRSIGTILEPTPGTFEVRGTNTYADAGSFTVIVAIADHHGGSATAATAATVTDAALASTGSAITAVQGQSVDVQVATFTDANPLATASDFAATIDWGDGSPTSAGTIVRKANGSFSVEGTHTYLVPTVPGSPRTLTVTIQDVGGSSTTAAGSATVVGAALTATGATVSAVEGQPFTGVVATFADTGGGQAAGSYTVVINWGDGTTSAPTSVSAAGSSPLGTTFTVRGSHTYAEEGTYAVGVSILSAAGSSATATGSAVVADAPLSGQIVPFTATAGVGFRNRTVATFTDTGGPETLGHYDATINWGDGSALSGGIVVADGSGFRVVGTHTYLASGNNPISVTIHDHGGAAITLNGSIAVAKPVQPPVTNLTARLDPASDTGVSRADNITSDSTPRFIGTATPGSIVKLIAVSPSALATPTTIGVAFTNPAGTWQVTSIPLSDGVYRIVAVASRGGAVATFALRPVTIDTKAPVVSSLSFDRSHGQLFIGMQDNLSGLDQRSLIDGSNYAFTKARAIPGRFLVTSLNASPFTIGSAPQTVTATINGGRNLRGGRYTLTVTSGGVRDRAGNALDGEFLGFFPSGNGIAGGNFVAILDTVHRRIFPPRPVSSTATPNLVPGTRGSGGTVTATSAPKSRGLVHDQAIASIDVARVTRKHRHG